MEAVRQKGCTLSRSERHRKQAAKADAAEKEARKQAAKADAINAFLIDEVLLQAAPEHNPNARNLSLRQALDHAGGIVARRS